MDINAKLDIIIQALRELRRELAEIEDELRDRQKKDEQPEENARPNTFEDDVREWYVNKDRFFEPHEYIAHVTDLDRMREAGHKEGDFH